MAGGAGSGDDPITDINVTPLVDIMLVLLIIFMVTTSVITEQEKVVAIPLELPSGASAEEMLSDGLLALTLDMNGDLYLNGVKSDQKRVALAIESIKLRKATPQALISADKRVPHGDVAQLMDFLRLNGVTQLAINTKRQAIE